MIQRCRNGAYAAEVVLNPLEGNLVEALLW